MRTLLLIALTLAGASAAITANAQTRPPLNPRPPVGGVIFPPKANGALACLADAGSPLAPVSLGLPALSGRDLSGSVTQSLRMTNDQCRATCGSQNFVYAGTQSGSFCFCGNSVGSHGTSTACTTGCSGYRGEMCGGVLANSVSLSGAPGPGFAGAPAPLTPLPPPTNGGQCVIAVSGAAYRHSEIQRWEVSGPPVIVNGNTRQYPMTWSVTGAGFKQDYAAAQGHSQANNRYWTLSGSQGVVYQALVSNADGHLHFGHQSNDGTGTLQDHQQLYIDGVAQNSPPIPAGGYLELKVTNLNLAPPLNPTLINSTFTLPVDDNHPYGFAWRPGSKGTISCTWNVMR
jgi:hypothetical protein